MCTLFINATREEVAAAIGALIRKGENAVTGTITEINATVRHIPPAKISTHGVSPEPLYLYLRNEAGDIIAEVSFCALSPNDPPPVELPSP